jgi:hypothetical protein
MKWTCSMLIAAFLLFGGKSLSLKVLILIAVGAAVIGCGAKNCSLNPEDAQRALVGSWQQRREGTMFFGGSYGYTIVIAFREGGTFQYNSNNDLLRKWGNYSVSGNVITVVATDSTSSVSLTQSEVQIGKTYTSTFGLSQDQLVLTLSGSALMPGGQYRRRGDR